MIIQGLPLQNSLRFWVSADAGSDLKGFLEPAGRLLNKEELRLSNNEIPAHCYWIDGLVADTWYSFILKDRNGNKIGETRAKTLPARLPENGFTLSIGSCYWKFSQRTKTIINSGVYPPKDFDSPQIRFLLGDQIYNDMFGPSITGVVKQPDSYENYRNQWADFSFQSFFQQTPNAVLADDHEFWNNYPHWNLHLAFWQNSLNKTGVDHVQNTALDCFNNYQLPLNPDRHKSFSFNIYPLEFFVLDTRIKRTHYHAEKPSFVDPLEKSQLLTWLNTLKGPGVLILGDVVADKTANTWTSVFRAGDFGLPDYGNDFHDLWNALRSAKHDVIVLAGDIHYGRFGFIKVPPRNENDDRKGTVFECVSSALCLLESSPDEYDPFIKFDASGNLELNDALEYVNIFSTQKGISNYAVINFREYGGGVEIKVGYYNVKDGSSLNNDNLKKLKFILF